MVDATQSTAAEAKTAALETPSVLVLNSGSSSIKFQVVDPAAEITADPFVAGLVEKIGEASGNITVRVGGEERSTECEIADHTVGLKRAFELMEELGAGVHDFNFTAVGHRVVHGGATFNEPVIIDDAVIESLRELIPLAPLHNPAHIAGIETAQALLGDIPHVAVFDTSFYADLPARAATYPINLEVAAANRVRRYGFHGTSHRFVSQQTPELLGKPADEVKQITLHLGNGASAAAVAGGRAMDTSMGMTPLGGLVMGTRSGDVDPGLVIHLQRTGGLSVDEVDTLLNRNSGVKGMCGSNDFRDVEKMMEAGDEAAQLAFEVYIHQLRRVIGSYFFTLGGADAIVFTAGVGENADFVRAAAMADLEHFGIKLDPERNAGRKKTATRISADDSEVAVFVIPTNEELAIAMLAQETAAQA